MLILLSVIQIWISLNREIGGWREGVGLYVFAKSNDNLLYFLGMSYQ